MGRRFPARLAWLRRIEPDIRSGGWEMGGQERRAAQGAPGLRDPGKTQVADRRGAAVAESVGADKVPGLRPGQSGDGDWRRLAVGIRLGSKRRWANSRYFQ